MTSPVGRTWWGRRWYGLVDEAGPEHARAAQRGQALARRGAVEDLRVTPGAITARVRDDRVSPDRVELRWPPAPEAAWRRATGRLAAAVRSTAALLEGELTPELADTLADAGVPLLPAPDELERHCTCPERGSWCRHVAAVLVATALAVDRDPFVLLGLRGRGREELLHALRADRDGGRSTATDLDLTSGLEGAHGDLDDVVLSPHPVDDPGALVRHLGDPPGVDDPSGLVDAIERAAATAWRLAAGEGASAADEELLLVELRAQRVGTPASVAAALGRDVSEVRAELDRLFAAGTVMRTGSGDDARYRTS